MPDQAARATGIFQLVALDCANCVPIITETLYELSGVHAVRVNVVIAKVYVDYDPRLTDALTIKAAIERGGYRVAGQLGRMG